MLTTSNAVDFPLGEFPCFCRSVGTQTLTYDMDLVPGDLVLDQNHVHVCSHSLYVRGGLTVVHSGSLTPVNQQDVITFLKSIILSYTLIIYMHRKLDYIINNCNFYMILPIKEAGLGFFTYRWTKNRLKSLYFPFKI